MLQRFRDHTPRIDPRAFVHATAVVIGRVSLGPDSSVWPCATLRGDDGPIVIGAQTSIQDGSVIHMTEGRSVTTVGDRVTVGHNVILHGCTVANECIIGMGAIVLDNAIIEAGCIVGAGTLVPPGKRVPAGSVAFGNPMRVVRSCTEADREFIAFSWQAYVHRTAQYLADAGLP
ncbi:MAG: gamma carbonic anhydrase family protein [Deltaproteobacteria bacterium]|nr:gamma carbonic anhydrase family protein [Nannocystaceae bacterium]